MNVLYSILTQGKAATAGNYYIKERSAVLLSDRMQTIRDILIPPSMSADRAAFAACVLCWLSSMSSMAQEVSERDALNTYSKPPRNVDAITGESDLLCYDWMTPETIKYKLVPLLDADIREAIQSGMPYDIIAAGCLQLLRCIGE